MDKVKIEVLTNDKLHWDKDYMEKRKAMETSTKAFLKECNRYILEEAPAFIRKDFKKG